MPAVAARAVYIPVLEQPSGIRIQACFAAAFQVSCRGTLKILVDCLLPLHVPLVRFWDPRKYSGDGALDERAIGDSGDTLDLEGLTRYVRDPFFFGVTRS